MGTIINIDEWMVNKMIERDNQAFENLLLGKATYEDRKIFEENRQRRAAIRERLKKQIEENN